MKALIPQPTEVGQWHALVSEAHSAPHLSLDEAVESDHVFLLTRLTDRADMARRAIVRDFLETQRHGLP